MLTVTKEYSFDCSHQLLNHDGLCKNIHGHTYKLFVTLTGPVVESITAHPKEGMIIDFKNLKSIVEEAILSKYDHAFIACGDEPILKYIQELGYKNKVIGCRTTCENMSRIMFKDINEALPVGMKVTEIKLYETPTSFATYTEED